MRRTHTLPGQSGFQLSGWRGISHQGGQVLNMRIGTIGVLVALLLTLTTCGNPIQAATGSSSTVAGGGGVVLPTDEVIYHAAHHVQVTLRDLDKVGDLLAAVVEAGANSVSGVSFAVEEPDALVEQARQEALENAAAKAAQMADGLDITLGKPASVMEASGGYPMTPVMVEWGVGGGGGGMAAPSIDPGSFVVSVSVQAVYQIQ